MSNYIDPWELPPLEFWAGRMLWRYLLILPFKVVFVLPLLAVSSFFYIVLLPYSLPFSALLHSLTFWTWRLFLGISLEVRDLRSDPNRKTKITVLNHASYMDGFVVGSVFKKFRTIAAFWAFSLPIYGQWLKASKSIPLYRAKENKNNAALIHEDDSDSTITLTVEGTMTNGKGLIKFRTGAFIGKTEVQPLVLQYLNKKFNTCWIKTSSPLWKHLIMAVSQVRNPVRITFLEPYFPSDEEKEQPALYSENVRKYMSEQSGLPLIDANYKDSPTLKESGE
jgi:lysophosphatidylcholine acyltransferase/lyso-PAF acetyltransferase